MRIALIADTFPPLRTSGAVQLRDLSLELARQGHAVTVILPSARLSQPWVLETVGGVEILRLRSPKAKDVSYIRRTLSELVMPFMMLKNLRRSPLALVHWDGVVWYSPTIFLGPIVNALKKASGCRSYLIIRDIFPQWALDMGLMRHSLPYWFFKAVEHYQYKVADTIGVQTSGNIPYFAGWLRGTGRRLEILENWLADAPELNCSIQLDTTLLSGRTIFVYAGNMGIAQGMCIFLDLAERLSTRSDIGFLFVGRGTDVPGLTSDAQKRGLKNILFKDEIPPEEIPGLYAQCHVGLVALDPNHKTHNIPGKFLTYMQSGLPVLANINKGNDLATLIHAENIGSASEDNSVDTLQRLAIALVSRLKEDPDMSVRCKALFAKRFSPEKAARQIVTALITPVR